MLSMRSWRSPREAEKITSIWDAAPRQSPAAKIAMAVVVSLSWTVASSCLILLNKHLMVDLGFHYPITVSCMGMSASAVLSFLYVRVARMVEQPQGASLRFFLTRIMPVGLCMAITLFTGNEVYLYLNVAFIQMLKAFTPVITMLALFAAALEAPSRRMVLSVLAVAAGTAVAAYGELRLSWLGLGLMLTSEVSEAIKLVMTQLLLVERSYHPIEGLLYLAPACCVWLGLGAAWLEVHEIRSTGALAILSKHKALFWLAACMGFIVNTLAYTTIKLASSLTLKVLGTAKNTVLVVVAMLLYREQVTGVQALGYAVSLAGFVQYNRIKLEHIATDHNHQPLPRHGSGSSPTKPSRTASPAPATAEP